MVDFFCFVFFKTMCCDSLVPHRSDQVTARPHKLFHLPRSCKRLRQPDCQTRSVTSNKANGYSAAFTARVNRMSRTSEAQKHCQWDVRSVLSSFPPTGTWRWGFTGAGVSSKLVQLATQPGAGLLFHSWSWSESRIMMSAYTDVYVAAFHAHSGAQ